MGRGNSTGAKTDLEGLDVADEEDEANLTKYSIVGDCVSEALLRKGERSGLANNQIDDLEANDRDQEGTLAILVSFNGIAYLLIGNLRVSPEMGYTVIVGIPSALGPIFLASEAVEQSEIKLRISVTVPEK